MSALDDKNKFLQLYPLGYVIFDIDSITEAVTPYNASKNPQGYEFNFKSVRLVENTPYRISIQLPEVYKDSQLLLTNATISGDPKKMQEFGNGYGFSNKSVLNIMGIAQVLQYNGNKVTWIFGLRNGY